ncbi:MAG: hypothetical protein HY695_18855 [Deltaproteobacteria bacterium]|nr:hypothetical protein [Deltaproteobacteria bacterium]
MKLSVKGLTYAAAIVWGLGFLFVGVVNWLWPPYGGAFLEVMASIYPGYRPMVALGNVIVGTLYAVLDGAIAGALFAWIYNSFAR